MRGEVFDPRLCELGRVGPMGHVGGKGWGSGVLRAQAAARRPGVKFLSDGGPPGPISLSRFYDVPPPSLTLNHSPGLQSPAPPQAAGCAPAQLRRGGHD